MEESGKPEDWIATDAEHPIGSNSMIVRQEKRNAQHAVNLDTMPNAAALHRK